MPGYLPSAVLGIGDVRGEGFADPPGTVDFWVVGGESTYTPPAGAGLPPWAPPGPIPPGGVVWSPPSAEWPVGQPFWGPPAVVPAVRPYNRADYIDAAGGDGGGGAWGPGYHGPPIGPPYGYPPFWVPGSGGPGPGDPPDWFLDFFVLPKP